MSLALYREYRPKSFDEVCGQQHIVKILKNEVENNNFSHAYLFVGPRGTGKTTCAKLLAKAANCINPDNGNPCGVCESCRAADEGNHLDITEIDAASNNGVDDIRTLRDEVSFSPNKSKYRVYIIDEVHMLSQSAFNALLKTLEEPPEYVIFILATTEVHKVLPTVISRCQRFDFKRIDENIISERLKLIAEKESIRLSDEASLLIARLSDGGMRDAVSLLDVCSSGNSDVTEETVSMASGLTGCSFLVDLCDCIIEKKPSEMLLIAEDCFVKGLTPQRLCKDIIMHLRNLMIIKTVSTPWEMIKCLKFEQEILKAQAERISINEILFTIDHFQNCFSDMSKGIDAKTSLETAFLIISDANKANDTKTLLKRIERLEYIINTTQNKIPNSSLNDINEKESSKKAEAAPPKALSIDETININEEVINNTANETQIFDQWQNVLSELEILNISIYNMLCGTKAYFNGKHVLIDVTNPLLLKMLKDNEYTKDSIKKAIFNVTGKNYPIGPYKGEKIVSSDNDPLLNFINQNSKNENFNIR